MAAKSEGRVRQGKPRDLKAGTDEYGVSNLHLSGL